MPKITERWLFLMPPTPGRAVPAAKLALGCLTPINSYKLKTCWLASSGASSGAAPHPRPKKNTMPLKLAGWHRTPPSCKHLFRNM